MVGAGIGGTTVAYHLRNLFENTGELEEIVILDPAPVGGRAATVRIAGHEYESGGSIIHTRNAEMVTLAAEFGLEAREAGPSHAGDLDLSSFSLQSGGNLVFSSSGDTAASDLVDRYGLQSLLDLYTFLTEMLNGFGRQLAILAILRSYVVSNGFILIL